MSKESVHRQVNRLGRDYGERIIPPAAQAENDAMAELSDKQQADMVRLTEMFSEYMRLKFEAITEDEA